MSITSWNRVRSLVIAVGLSLCGLQGSAQAATKVAVIDNSVDPPGAFWCSFLNDNGYQCTLFPASGPTQPLDDFAVVIDMSSLWTDSGHLLAAVMQSGRGVITWGRSPAVLGVDTDPVIQAWIGANAAAFDNFGVTTTATDSILGNLPLGTEIAQSGKFGAWALDDTSGHPHAKVLARHNSGTTSIALIRNTWIGRSVYFSNAFHVGPGYELHEEIILRAVGELSVRTIPTTSTWGVICFALLIACIGSILLRSKSARLALRGVAVLLVVGNAATVKAEISVTQENGVNVFRIENSRVGCILMHPQGSTNDEL